MRVNYKYRTQSFPSLKADLNQYIEGDFAFSRCLTKWNCISLKKFLHQDIGTFTLAQIRRVTNTNLLI